MFYLQRRRHFHHLFEIFTAHGSHLLSATNFDKTRFTNAGLFIPLTSLCSTLLDAALFIALTSFCSTLPDAGLFIALTSFIQFYWSPVNYIYCFHLFPTRYLYFHRDRKIRCSHSSFQSTILILLFLLRKCYKCS